MGVAQLSSNHWAVSACGFNAEFANKLLVLIDGRTVYTPSSAGVFWNAQDVVLEDIDRIEVIRGPGATLWGSNAVNGVINITTKRAQDTQGVLVSGLADSEPSSQWVANLMGNAEKFTEHGEVLLGMRLRRTPETGHKMLQVIVRDTGIGMTTETLSTLFTEFTQADSSTTRKYGGTGLGLAISKRVVDAMNGFVRVKSRVGHGTTFSVHLPLKQATTGVHSARRPISGLKCLIVDKNGTNRRVLEHYLGGEAVACQSETSPLAGFAALRRAAAEGMPYDFVLFDHQMPEMDGTLCHEVHRIDSSWSTCDASG